MLPPIGRILNELGCWDDVEAAGFPIKIGATYRWGNSDRLWDFEFMPLEAYREESRPRAWSRQARQLALQVERARYDKILLEHAGRLGCEVFQPAQVRRIHTSGDQVEALTLANGEEVSAHWYVDASGASAILRRTIGVGTEVPTRLQNVAFWDYWENAEWAIRYPGGATRVLVLSIGSGWVWFIPLSLTRTSIGFVCPRDFYRESDKTPEEIYLWALQQEPLIRELTLNATRSGTVNATRDWSFVASRLAGENWLLAGEAAGFADPILAAGMTLAQSSAREAAYTIIALSEGADDPAWLKSHYEMNQQARLRQHIRFADFWYSANGNFTDLQRYTAEIARDAGLELEPDKAFQWLGMGGFTLDVPGQVGIGALDLAGARQIAQRFVGGETEWQLSKFNRLFLQLEGAEEQEIPAYENGRIHRVRTYCREGRQLPVTGMFAVALDAVRPGPELVTGIIPRLQSWAVGQSAMEPSLVMHHLLQVLEVMLGDGWLRGERDPAAPGIDLRTPVEGRIIHTNQELNARLKER